MSPENQSFLHASFGCDINGMQTALGQGANINVFSQGGGTALYRAAYWGEKDSVRFLLDHRANVNMKTLGRLEYALHAACEIARSEDRWPDKKERLPMACYEEIIAMLIAAGADVHVANKEQDTALHIAAGKKSPIVVHALIGAGADIMAKNKKNRTPLHNATHCSSENLCVDIVRLLLAQGADVDAVDCDGASPRGKAIANGFLPILEATEKGKSGSAGTSNSTTKFSKFTKIRERIIRDYAAPDEHFDMGNTQADGAEAQAVREQNVTDGGKALSSNDFSRTPSRRARIRMRRSEGMGHE